MTLGDFPFELTNDGVNAIAGVATSIFGPALDAYEGALIAAAPAQVAAVREFVAAHTDPFTAALPMMDPVTLSFLLVSYFVGLGAFYLIGRATGKLELRGFGILYNFVCVVLSLYMSVGLGWEAYNSFPTLWNNPVDASHPRATSIRNILWVFYASKLLEYTDTFIMVLKHNYRQVSFLHVYHHTSIVVVVYAYLMLAPGGDSYWCSMVNSGIHVVMYLYYLLNLIFRAGPVRNFLQANKLIITVGQLTQFLLNVVQAVFILFIASPKRYPTLVMWVQVVYMATMIFLFGNFLVKNKKGGSGKKKAVAGGSKKKAE